MWSNNLPLEVVRADVVDSVTAATTWLELELELLLLLDAAATTSSVDDTAAGVLFDVTPARWVVVPPASDVVVTAFWTGDEVTTAVDVEDTTSAAAETVSSAAVLLSWRATSLPWCRLWLLDCGPCWATAAPAMSGRTR